MAQTVLLNMCMVTKPGTQTVLVLDKKHCRWSGLTFPGGHVEPGESFSHSVRREFREETGLSIKGERLCGVVHWCDPETGDRRVLFLYRTSQFEGTLVQETEEGEVFWMELADLIHSPRLSDGIADYLKIFLREENSEAFALVPNGDWDGFEIL
ncbi:MAG: 8-oxo-dGTP diphosphatase [Clostridiales bacterium]|jgi:8-oxo-dGTP diphosphatase|nr:8-oxo-dGTP diphosphatase [Clostridiales bacterium]